MKKHRPVSKVVCSLFALVAVATAGMITAGAAGNISDSTLELNINYLQSTDYTPIRNKLDSTSTYMWVDDKSGAIITRVVGSNQEDISSFVDCSRGHIYPANLGVTYMINYVYENGYTWAAIRGDQSSTSNAGVTGEWSPDSV